MGNRFSQNAKPQTNSTGNNLHQQPIQVPPNGLVDQNQILLRNPNLLQNMTANFPNMMAQVAAAPNVGPSLTTQNLIPEEQNLQNETVSANLPSEDADQEVEENLTMQNADHDLQEQNLNAGTAEPSSDSEASLAEILDEVPAPESFMFVTPVPLMALPVPSGTPTTPEPRVELLLSSSVNKLLEGGISSTNCFHSAQEMIDEMEEYNNSLEESSTDLSESSSEESELSFSEEGLTESEEDVKYATDLKEMMDKMSAPGPNATVASDSQLLSPGGQDNLATEIPLRNCFSDIGINQHHAAADSNPNKRKIGNDGDLEDESESKRLALDAGSSAENGNQMEMFNVE